MKPLKATLSLIAVISLFVGAIWQSPASAATSPVLTPLGRFLDYSVIEVPSAIDVDDAGNIYVVDSLRKRVAKFDKYLKFLRYYDKMRVYGSSLAVTNDGRKIIVGSGEQVDIVDGDSGEVITALGVGDGEFTFAVEIDIDPLTQRVYVADMATFGVKVYDLNSGEYLFRFGSKGYGNGQFRNIWSLSFNEYSGEVYVSDIAGYSTIRPSVQVFNRDGQFLRNIKGYDGFGAPPVPFFSGMTFDPSGRAYVLDILNGAIRFLGLPTTPLGQFKNPGYRPGQMAMPRGIIYDKLTGRLFVTCDGARIEIYGVDGAENPANANVAPGQPVPVSPVGDVEVVTATPQLNYLNATDNDGDNLVYDVQVFSASEVVADYIGLPSGATESYAQVAAELTENARFGWHVRAFDGEAASDWTAQQYFYVNAQEEAPVAPVLLAPEAGTIAAGATVLSWGTAVDPDPFDTVSYRVEIAADATFAELVASADLTGNAIMLSEFADYLALQDGQTYFWRALAVDNHGLVSVAGDASNFVYDTTVLRFSANMPDAAVYLGGNYAYSGRYIGHTPVELRDVPAGVETVVVKRAGFEPFVGKVVIGERENIDFYAQLVAAIMPAELKANPLSADGQKIVLNGAVAPFIADVNADGVVDLVAASADGAINLFTGALVDGELEFTAAGLLAAELPLISGACPLLVDWNNDRVSDLLVGGADGTVSLFVAVNGVLTPTSLTLVGGAPVIVAGDAAPVVYDIDADGDKDLLVGSSDGTIAQFINVGSDAAPQLSAAGNLSFTMAPSAGPVAPFVTDWDADGSDDLLVTAGEHIYVYQSAGAVWSPVGVLAVTDALLNNNNGKSKTGAYSIGTGLTLFALDLDGKKGKDLLVGNDSGEIRLVRSFGKDYVAAFNAALVDKVAQITTANETPVDSAALGAAIAEGDYKQVAKECRSLLLTLDAAATVYAQELLDILK
ncbi:MAG: PEGA domain-containing protein [Desulfuromonadaceae bacterium]|nr:PEGA domain-containing protein [Desulfuromonadaceae bacterium]